MFIMYIMYTTSPSLASHQHLIWIAPFRICTLLWRMLYLTVSSLALQPVSHIHEAFWGWHRGCRQAWLLDIRPLVKRWGYRTADCRRWCCGRGRRPKEHRDKSDVCINCLLRLNIDRILLSPKIYYQVVCIGTTTSEFSFESSNKRHEE